MNHFLLNNQKNRKEILRKEKVHIEKKRNGHRSMSIDRIDQDQPLNNFITTTTTTTTTTKDKITLENTLKNKLKFGLNGINQQIKDKKKNNKTSIIPLNKSLINEEISPITTTLSNIPKQLNNVPQMHHTNAPHKCTTQMHHLYLMITYHQMHHH